jgi:N-acetylmuramoyl-L-alanine amidase
MNRAVTLDAGHGGDQPVGSSTPNRAVGPGGLCEKDVTLDLARRVRDRLVERGLAVRVTRALDENLSLADRIAVAYAQRARAFVSLHFNASSDPDEQGCEAWIHDRASRASRVLAERVVASLVAASGNSDRGVKVGPLAVLDPDRHRPETAACLAEVSFLTDREEEARLADPDYRDQLADALADAVDDFPGLVIREDEQFDLWHEVPLVHQTTGMSCWAAAAAMIVGWRDCIDVDPEEVARGSNRWEAYREGLEPHDVDGLATAWGLVVEPSRAYSVGDLRALLERYGPLWMGEASPGLHVVVIAGMHGDGTLQGTFVRVADPWPIGIGERYTITFAELRRNYDAVEALTGMRACVLHAGGAPRGNRAVSWQRTVEARLGERR